jgi:hypothetical protein
MPSTLAKSWNSLTRGKPGHRFRDRYHRNQKSDTARSWFWQIVRFVLAAVALAIAIVLAVIPGPAIVFFIISGALISSDWLWMARLMDWSEVRLRQLWDAAMRIWRRLPVGGRIALAATGAIVSAASTYGFYRLMQ